MSRSDEGMTPRHEDDIAQEERDSEASAGTHAGGDEAHRTSPPGNPATDEEAVDKGEENLGRITGR